MVRIAAPAVGGRAGWVACGFVVSMLTASATFAQQPPAGQPPAGQPPAGQPPAQQAQSVSNARLFNNDGGMVLNFIKPDKTADFEMVIGKVKEALQKSDKPQRKEQAAGWKVFKSPDPAGANALYVFVIDPAVKGADYQISNILAEALPAAEANEILKKYADCYAQAMNIVNLNLVQAFGK